ncbi:MAG: multiheme c-type cytochrome [Pseudomonadales bacterium]|jgi:hypothetical protein|nr:multiheme c-type cytochrome [Pseudomonadales bacterium]
MALTLLALCLALYFCNGYLLLAMEWLVGFGHLETDASWSYQVQFALHLGAAPILTAVLAAFIGAHVRRKFASGSRRTRIRGFALAASWLIIVVSGAALIRLPGEPSTPQVPFRSAVYAIHVILPFLAACLFVLHRKAAHAPLGQRTLRRLYAAGTVSVLTVTMLLVVTPSPAKTSSSEERTTIRRAPSPLTLEFKEGDLARTLAVLEDTERCASCHQDTHVRWLSSAHRHASLTNPFYRSAVTETRRFVRARDGDVRAARFCAGCHDPLPLLAGAFDSPEFDTAEAPYAKAGITCMTCHAARSKDSRRGNGALLLSLPAEYPFADSGIPAMRWFSDVLLASNPAMHKRDMLTPFHRRPEFCGSCHKVSVPESLNGKHWLRGQNHLDSFLQSGASGTSLDSFNYPETPHTNCNGCHMPLRAASDMAASGTLQDSTPRARDHFFPSANTAVTSTLSSNPLDDTREHLAFLEGSVELAIVGFRSAGEINGSFIPVRNGMAWLRPDERYLLELVISNRRVGHVFTGGTADSNQVWIGLRMRESGRVIAASGCLDPETNRLHSAGTHPITRLLVDEYGNPIDRRNVEDIVATAFSTEVPPGASRVVHYRFRTPAAPSGPIQFEAELLYRKFSTDYLNFSLPSQDGRNTLPVARIHRTQVDVMLEGSSDTVSPERNGLVDGLETRLNDYAIAMLLADQRAQFRQAEQLFTELADRGFTPARLNLIRLLLEEGRIEEADVQLSEIDHTRLPNPWTAQWYAALVALRSGDPEQGVTLLESLRSGEGIARSRGFDFSRDYDLLDALIEGYLLRAATMGGSGETYRNSLLEALQTAHRLLELDPERAPTHHRLRDIYRLLGDGEKASEHDELFDRYHLDETITQAAIARARRRDPWIDALAQPVVIHELAARGSCTLGPR